MSAADDASRERARRWASLLAASAFAGAVKAAHILEYQKRIAWGPVGFTTLAVLVELVALTAVFEHGLRRRTPSGWTFAASALLAPTIGIARSGIEWAIQSRFSVPLLGMARRWSPGAVVQVGLSDGLLGLALWAVAVVLPFAIRDANARALEAERLRTSAELARLRAHLTPHFLLNTLNTAAGLVGDDPTEARNVLGALGDLLGDSAGDADEVQTLDEEVRWLQRYASILETRHRGALAFRWDVADDVRRVRVPRLLLQPLLENAVKHGALRRREGGEVTVRAERVPETRDRVRCVVEDNGPGPSGKPTRPGALGIQIVTRRLELEYRGAATFRLESDGGRTRSVVEVPSERRR